MESTPSSLSWAEVNKLIRETTELYGVSLAIITTPSGTKPDQWRVDCVASVEPIMKDGVYVNWWTQQECRRTVREGGRNSYASLASQTYWTVADMRDLLWEEFMQTALPV